jgi:hypothetical protein
MSFSIDSNQKFTRIRPSGVEIRVFIVVVVVVFSNVPNAPPVKDTQVISSKERKCGVCGVVGHKALRCPTIVNTGEFFVANSFSSW